MYFLFNFTQYLLNKMYQLKHTQQLPISLNDAWDFLSNPANLRIITPDNMSFNVLSESRSMYAGQIIQYTVKPLLGIKTKWVTEITHVQPKHYFVDEQRLGPYKIWHHQHFLKEIEGGVLMEDIVHYKIPFGILGRLVHPILVKPKLNTIFEYRRKKLIEIFGAYNIN